MKDIKVYSIISGKSRVEFSLWKTGKGYQARVNNVPFFESQDYAAASDAVNDGLDSNTWAYIGGMTH